MHFSSLEPWFQIWQCKPYQPLHSWLPTKKQRENSVVLKSDSHQPLATYNNLSIKDRNRTSDRGKPCPLNSPVHSGEWIAGPLSHNHNGKWTLRFEVKLSAKLFSLVPWNRPFWGDSDFSQLLKETLQKGGPPHWTASPVVPCPTAFANVIYLMLTHDHFVFDIVYEDKK